jgi:hypothetical protein
MTDASEPKALPEFLAFRGGPFYELQYRLRLLRRNSLHAGRRAALYVALTFGVPFLLALPDSLSIDGTGHRYLADPGTWATFVIAIAAFVLAEAQIEKGLHAKLLHFQTSRLIAETSIDDAVTAVNRALRRRNSFNAEIICAIIAAVFSLAAFFKLHEADLSTWAVTVSSSGRDVTLAGWWTLIVSQPMFVFLLTRGLWRHFVWAQLLRRIASLDLRLVSTHPDGKGGLGFVATYPNAYMLFVFGMSASLAAALAKHHLQGGLTPTALATVMACWLALVLAVFGHPLSAFSAPLFELRQKTLGLLSAKGTAFFRTAERKLFDENVMANSEAEAQETEEADDPSKQYTAVSKQSTMLLSRSALVPVGLAALLPFAIVAATVLPLKEIWSVVKKVLLL